MFARPTRRAVCRAAAAALLLAPVAFAASSPRSDQPPGQAGETPQTQTLSLYDQGVELANSEQWAEARQIFEKLERDKPKDPDVLNMLAFTQRKTGNLDEALVNYQRALKQRPKFLQAREYLGEAYLQLALREIDTLRGYGGSGKDELEQLVAAFHEAASKLEAANGKSAAKW